MRVFSGSRSLGLVALPLLFGCGERAMGPADFAGRENPPVASGGPSVPNHLIAEVAAGWTVAQINLVFGTSTIALIDGSPFALLQIPVGQTFETLSAELLLSGACTSCERNRIVSSPEAQQGSIAFYEGDLTTDDVADQQAMTRVRANLARNHGRGKGIMVAVLDTGIDATHPDLADHVRPNGYDFVMVDSNPDDEADGLDQDLDGSVDEGTGHGTHVAGVVQYIAPMASLLPVRVLDSEGNGTIFGVAQGLDFATTSGAQVINLSLALDDHSTVGEWAVQRANAAGIFLRPRRFWGWCWDRSSNGTILAPC